MRAVDAVAFEALTKLFEVLNGKASKLLQSATQLKTAVGSTHCLNSALARVLLMEHAGRLKSSKGDETRARTLCPLGNVEVLTYSNDGAAKIRRAETQHAKFGQSKDGRIFCIHPACVQARGGGCAMPETDSRQDMLDFVSTSVDAGTLEDPVQHFLSNEGRCRVCKCSTYLKVVREGKSIACVKCSATVHTSCLLVERHDAASGCVDPGAGVFTSQEQGSVTCLGCGLVLSDSLCIESEADERVFLDEEDDPTHHAAAASPFLSNGSNVTFISRGRGSSKASAEDVKSFKKYAWMHSKMNSYVSSDDLMRLTTWVKRDSHVKHLQDIITDCTAAGILQLSKTSQDIVMQRFKDIRWSSEKMYGIRLVVFALVAYEVIESRERASLFKYHEYSTCCGCGEKVFFRDLRVHLLACKQKQQLKKPLIRRKTYKKFSENVLFC